MSAVRARLVPPMLNRASRPRSLVRMCGWRRVINQPPPDRSPQERHPGDVAPLVSERESVTLRLPAGVLEAGLSYGVPTSRSIKTEHLTGKPEVRTLGVCGTQPDDIVLIHFSLLYRCPHSRFFVRGISFEDVAAHADHGNCQTVTRRACLQPVVMLHSVLAETCSTLPPSYLAGCGPRGGRTSPAILLRRRASFGFDQRTAS
jgi:hypothetical protein